MSKTTTYGRVTLPFIKGECRAFPKDDFREGPVLGCFRGYVNPYRIGLTNKNKIRTDTLYTPLGNTPIIGEMYGNVRFGY